MYLSEIPPQNIRGLTGTINALAMCIGNLITNIFGLPILLGRDNLWPFLLGIRLVPSLVHIIGLPFCIESPKHLYITKNQNQKALKALEKLRSNDKEIIEYEINQLFIEKESMKNQTQISYLSLFQKPSLRRALIVSIA